VFNLNLTINEHWSVDKCMKKPLIRKQVKKMSKKGLVIVLLYAMYITFILLSRMPLLAEIWVEPKMEDNYEYNLSFLTDGKQSHYEVERYDQNIPGTIYIKYYSMNNTLKIEATNIKNLSIDCRSMFEDECQEIFRVDPKVDSNYYKHYFIEKNHLKVHINTHNNITRLGFKDTPIPYNVTVNGENWLPDVNYSYSNNYGTIISEIPMGYSWVDIYFRKQDINCPVAKFDVTETTVEVYDIITFDASKSMDPDGRITNYFWDFGDGTFISGTEQPAHHYTNVGTYSVILTVRDEDNLLDRAYGDIIVIPEKSEDGTPQIMGKIPNQEMVEDCDPWSLDLNKYESILEVPNNPLNWWVTGENNSLYALIGENSSTDTLTFSPVSNAYGNNIATIWLGDNSGVRDSQTIWINITSVNDPPSIFGTPDIVVHYDQTYTFNYTHYIKDLDTPKEELILSTSDPDNTEVIDGLNVNFKYPKSLLGKTIYVIITVSDGEGISEDIVGVTVSDDWLPILKKPLPDVYLEEGETKNNYFDLDDYYSDPDGDALYYSFGNTHIQITIHDNHSVDFKAPDNWGGREIVTIRATDPAGAKVEDIIVVSVKPINDAPIIEGVPDLVLHYDELYSFDLLPYVTDEDNTLDELTISTTEKIEGLWKDSKETGYIQINPYNNLLLEINYPKNFLDHIVLVNITVSDGDHSDSQIIQIWITSNYPPELIQSLPDISFFEDVYFSNAFDLSAYFLDRDFDDLYYSYGEVNIDVTINENGTVDLSAAENWYGTELVTFRATDPEPYEAIAEDTILITIIPVNDAPVVDIIPTQKSKVGDTWVLDLMRYIHDIDNNLTELNITVDANCIDCEIKGTDLIFYGTSAIKKTITIEVSDGEKNAKQTILVIITQTTEEKSELLALNLVGALVVLIIAGIAIITYRKYKSNYIIEEIFLIHKYGDLISHKTRKLETQVDEDILSAMFTVVQDFIKDSFAKRAKADKDWALDELKVGENKILIDRGQIVYLTVIFSGSSLAGKKLRKRTKVILKAIENKYASEFESWAGNMSKVEGADRILAELLPNENK